MEPVGDNVAE